MCEVTEKVDEPGMATGKVVKVKPVHEIPTSQDIEELKDFFVETVRKGLQGSEEESKIAPRESPFYSLQEQAGISDMFSSAYASVEQMTAFSSEVHSMMEKVRNIMEVASDTDFQDRLLLRLERTVVFSFGLVYSDNVSTMMIHTYMYLSAYWSKSMVDQIWKKIAVWRGQFQEDLHEQGCFDGKLSDNWATIMKGSFGKHIGKILTLLLSFGIMPEGASSWVSDNVFKAFEVKHPRFMKEDMFEYILSIIDWITNTVWPAWHAGDASMLLMAEDASSLDLSFAKCVRHQRQWDLGMTDDLKDDDITDDVQIVEEIDRCMIAHANRLKMCSSVERNPLQQRVLALQKLSDGIRASWKKSKLRMKPFAVLLSGRSSVGKSTVAGIIAHVVSIINSFPKGDKYQVTLNGMDKYQSEYFSHHLIVIIDDLCNTRAEREEGNPLFKLIQFINNMHCAALKADVDSKGNIDIRCKLVIVTTNKKDLNAAYFSISPASIMRRFDLVIDVSVKKDCQGPNGSIDTRFRNDSMPDCWDFTVSTVKVVDEEGHDNGKYQLVPVPEAQSIVGLVSLLEKMTPQHFAIQADVVESTKDMHLKEHCHTHPLFTTPCAVCNSLANQAGFLKSFVYGHDQDDEEGDLFEDACGSIELDNVSLNSSNYPVLSLRTRLERMECYPDLLQMSESMSLAAKSAKKRAQDQLKRDDMLYKCTLVFVMVAGAGFCMKKMRDHLGEQGNHIERINMLSATPKQLVEVDDAYKKAFRLPVEFPKASVSSTPLQFRDKVDTNLYTAFVTEVDRISLTKSTKTRWCVTTPMGNASWMFPKHMFEEGKLYEVACHITDPKETVGTKHIIEMIDGDGVARSAQRDLAIVRLLRGGSCWNLSKYCYQGPLERVISIGDTVHLYHRHKDKLSDVNQSPTETPITAIVRDIGVFTSNGNQYEGFKYTLSVDSFNGLCGALVVSTGKNPTILGFHVAGGNNYYNLRVGAACQYIESDFAPRDKDDIRVSDETFNPTNKLGREYNLSGDVNARSGIHWLEKDKVHSLEILGQHDVPTSHFKSDVRESIIADELTNQLGIVPKHCAPKARYKNMALQKFLSNASQVLPPKDPRILEWAKRDLILKIDEFLDKCPAFVDRIKPMSYKDALNGVEGIKGFDPINLNTSVGWPLNCPKYKLLIEEAIDSKLKGGSARLLTLDDTIGDQQLWSMEIIFDPEKCDVEGGVENLLDELKSDERANVIFRANLKDEALPIEKAENGKIRVFCGATVDLVLVCRMLLLPLFNSMTYFPEIFESAVGVNAQGRDWEQIHKIVTKFGEERVFAGDYGKFDQRQRPEDTTIAWDIIKHICSRCGYDEEHLAMLDGLATVVIFPQLEFNGTLLKMFGINPSGQPGTVVLNGFVNMIYMRYAYYKLHFNDKKIDLHPDKKVIPLFHMVVALITYGDDNVANVSEQEKLFNHTSVSEILSGIGLEYTMADKNSESVPFLHISQVSFLKRMFVVHPVLNEIVAPLEIDSINKSLMMSRKPSKNAVETEAQIMAMNMRSALIYAWFHSPALYWEYANAFKEMLHITDSSGNPIGLYYDFIQEEEIVRMWSKTRTAYPDANDLIEQSGQIDRFDLHKDMFKEWCNRDRQRRQRRRVCTQIREIATCDGSVIVAWYVYSKITRGLECSCTTKSYQIYRKLALKQSVDLPVELYKKVLDFLDDNWVIELDQDWEHVSIVPYTESMQYCYEYHSTGGYSI